MLVSTYTVISILRVQSIDIFYMLPALDYAVLGDLLLSTTYSPTFDLGIELWDIRVVSCAATDSGQRMGLITLQLTGESRCGTNGVSVAASDSQVLKQG